MWPYRAGRPVLGNAGGSGASGLVIVRYLRSAVGG
jgi:hypothetical protein